MSQCICITLKNTRCKITTKNENKICHLHQNCKNISNNQTKITKTKTISKKIKPTTKKIENKKADSKKTETENTKIKETKSMKQLKKENVKSPEKEKKDIKEGIENYFKMAKFDETDSEKKLLNFGDIFKIDEKLGQGGYGKVFLVKDADDNKYALKVYFMDSQPEINALSLLSLYPNCDPNIVCMYDNFKIKYENIIGKDTTDNIFGNYKPDDYIDCVLLEYIPGIDLFDYINFNRLNKMGLVVTGIKLGVFLTLTISKLNKKNLIYRDIKPENIIVHNDNFKLIDPGLVCQIGDENKGILKCQGMAGSILFLPPISFKFTPEEFLQMDIFSIGVTLFMFLHKQYPYGPDYQANNTAKYNDLKSGVTKLDDLLKRMLEFDYTKRITVHQAYEELLSLHNP